MHHALFWNSENVLVGYRKYSMTSCRPRRKVKSLLFASSDDGVTVNEDSQDSSSSNATDLEKIRVTLNRPLVNDEDFCDGLLQSLYDAARVFELEIKEQNSLSRLPWFSTNWFGVDRIAWEKTLAYQVISVLIIIA